MILGLRLQIFIRNLLVESQINPNFPVSANLKRCMEDFLFVERTRTGRQCKCFIWVTNHGTIHMEMLSNFSCPYRKSKLKHYRQSAFKQHNRKPSKNSCKPADFRKILQFTCGYIWAVKKLGSNPHELFRDWSQFLCNGLIISHPISVTAITGA